MIIPKLSWWFIHHPRIVHYYPRMGTAVYRRRRCPRHAARRVPRSGAPWLLPGAPPERHGKRRRQIEEIYYWNNLWSYLQEYLQECWHKFFQESWNTFTVRVHKNHSSQQMFDLRLRGTFFFEEWLVARVGVHQAVKSWFDHPNRFPIPRNKIRNMYGINMYNGQIPTNKCGTLTLTHLGWSLNPHIKHL